MKKLHRYLYIPLLLCWIVGYSQVPNPSVDATNKRLIFNSKEDVKTFLDFYRKEENETAFETKISSLENQGFESLLNVTKRELYYQNGTIELLDDDIEEDYYIGDTPFAKILSVNHDIVVGGILYYYLEDGLYFSSPSNQIKLRNVAKSSRRSINYNSPDLIIDDTPFFQVDTDIYYFPFNYKKTITSHIEMSSTTKTNSYTNPYNLGGCQFDDSGFFEGILPGGREACHDDISNTRRIRVVFSNQNYFLFSAVFSKVKSQKRNCVWGICSPWYRDNFCDFIELGLSEVVLKYPTPMPTPHFNNANLIIRNNFDGGLYTSNGEIISPYDPSVGFKNWPFPRSEYNFEIYYFLGTTTLDGEDLNGAIEKAIEGLLNYTGQTFDQLFTTNGTKVGIAIDDPNGVYFVNYGTKIRKYGRSIIEETWDVNLQIGWKFDAEDIFGGDNNPIFIPAKTYEVIKLDMYGAGKYNGSMRGKRIFLTDEANGSSASPDADGDGITNSKDACKYQYGNSKNFGCPLSVVTKDALFVNRLNETAGTLGSCYDLELKASDYPIPVNTIKGKNNQTLMVRSANQIIIKGNSNLTLKPSNSNTKIVLQINPNACQMNTMYGKNDAVDFFTAENIGQSEEQSFIQPSLSPNPTTTILNVENINDLNEWKLVDINGKIVKSGKINNSIQTKITINTNRLLPGVYYFNAVMKNGELFQKTVMKK